MSHEEPVKKKRKQTTLQSFFPRKQFRPMGDDVPKDVNLPTNNSDCNKEKNDIELLGHQSNNLSENLLGQGGDCVKEKSRQETDCCEKSDTEVRVLGKLGGPSNATAVISEDSQKSSQGSSYSAAGNSDHESIELFSSPSDDDLKNSKKNLEEIAEDNPETSSKQGTNSDKISKQEEDQATIEIQDSASSPRNLFAIFPWFLGIILNFIYYFIRGRKYFIESSDIHSAPEMGDMEWSSDPLGLGNGIWGTPLSDFRIPSNPKLPTLKVSKDHAILIDCDCVSVPEPFPGKHDKKNEKWDEAHVQMPYSDENEILVEENGHQKLACRWEVIKAALKEPLKSSIDIEKAISKYNRHHINFEGFHSYMKHLNDHENHEFFHTVLPEMIKLVLGLPEICTGAIPLLRKQTNSSVTMSQKQAACILANAFFCTFPKRERSKKTKKKKVPTATLR